MQIKVLQVGVIGTNCYLLEDETTGTAGIIDPGGNGKELLAQLERDGVKPVCILLTHAHFDHTGGVEEIRSVHPDLPVYLHPADAALTGGKAKLMGYAEFPDIGRTTPYQEGDTVQVGSLTVRVLDTPGHTPGGVTLLVEREGVLFTGDTLFQGSIGRTDLTGGDYDTLLRSLKKLDALEGDYHVLPGHMDGSTLNRERRSNYYMAEAARR